jgi:hypothetical protein
MKTYILLIITSLLFGTVIGYLGRNLSQQNFSDKHYNMTHKNSALLEKIHNQLNHLESGSISATVVASDHTDPTEKQLDLYKDMQQRIYTYAASGQPLMEAMSSDPEFQQLTNEQKKQLAIEIVGRFNRGEITMDQIQGR